MKKILIIFFLYSVASSISLYCMEKTPQYVHQNYYHAQWYKLMNKEHSFESLDTDCNNIINEVQARLLLFKIACFVSQALLKKVEEFQERNRDNSINEKLGFELFSVMQNEINSLNRQVNRIETIVNVFFRNDLKEKINKLRDKTTQNHVTKFFESKPSNFFELINVIKVSLNQKLDEFYNLLFPGGHLNYQSG